MAVKKVKKTVGKDAEIKKKIKKTTKRPKTKKTKVIDKTDNIDSTPVETIPVEKESAQKEGAVNIEPGSNIPKDTKDKIKNHLKKTETLYTHDGHKLTPKVAKFIDYYLSTGNVRQSVVDAGFKCKAPGQYGNELLHKPYVNQEIEYRMTKFHEDRVADGQEVMQFFTSVMRGEVKDQFGLDAPLSERMKAGQEIARRTVDIANKIAGVTNGENEITIKLDWDRTGV